MRFCASVLGEFNAETPIIFSDESKFQLNANHQWVWTRRGEYNEHCFVDRTKFPSSIMVFGAIGIGYKSNLIIVDGTIDASVYQSILKEANIKNDVDKLHGRGNYLYQQDGAPAHTSKSSIRYISTQFNLLRHWPPQSPDLNPIENLWGVLKRRVASGKPQTREDLRKLVEESWSNIPQEVVDNIVFSFLSRTKLVLVKKGECVQHIVRKNIIEQIDDPIEGIEGVKPYSDIVQTVLSPMKAKDLLRQLDQKNESFERWEDETLIDLVNRCGLKWPQFANILGRTSAELKNRYNGVLKKKKR